MKYKARLTVMEKSNIRTAAINWMNTYYPEVENAIMTSKFYTPEESWSNSRVWFFQIPLQEIDTKKNRFINLVCQNHLKGDDFLNIKVPSSFFIINEKSFEVDYKEKVIRLYLSAEAVDMFKEVRKGSKLDFKKYIQNPPKSIL
ncbi:hypothetical protein [Ferruginibacter sp.]|nr:hypothetical protein [Ferruginibacter sp.]